MTKPDASVWPAKDFDALLLDDADPVDADHPLARAAERGRRIVRRGGEA